MNKIVHLTSVHTLFDVRIFQKQCSSLVKNGYDVTIVAPSDELGQSIVNGVKITTVKKTHFRLLRPILTAGRVFYAAKKIEADLYHFHDPELLWVGVLLKVTGAKVIYDVHEDLPLDIMTKLWIPAFLRKPLSFMANKIEKKLTGFIDGVVAATPAIENNFRNYTKQICNIKNYPIKPDKAYFNSIGDKVCYVGLLAENRGLIDIIIASFNAGVKLILCGNFVSTEFQEKCEALREWRCVEYLGFVKPSDLNSKIFSQCFAGLVVVHDLPQFRVGIPTKMFDYMAAKLGVIYSNFPYFNELVGDYNCGITVEAANVDEIAKAITNLKNDKARAKAMGEKGFNAIQTSLNWTFEIKQLICFYNDILAKKAIECVE